MKAVRGPRVRIDVRSPVLERFKPEDLERALLELEQTEKRVQKVIRDNASPKMR